MAPSSDRSLLVLHALRLGGLLSPQAVGDRSGTTVDQARKLLEQFKKVDQVRHREGRLAGWLLTSAGRAAGEGLLAAELETTGARTDVAALYQRFLAMNGELLTTCTAWQLVDEVEVNDHTDSGYDEMVIRRLSAVDQAAQPICSELASLLKRFGSYQARLGQALASVKAGEVEWFTSPMVDSYHTVWFELHEDLLATLGIERSSEGAKT